MDQHQRLSPLLEHRVFPENLLALFILNKTTDGLLHVPSCREARFNTASRCTLSRGEWLELPSEAFCAVCIFSTGHFHGPAWTSLESLYVARRNLTSKLNSLPILEESLVRAPLDIPGTASDFSQETPTLLGE